ncbi:hypothetical protein [Homoserinibacter gongjuensis]|uniref:Polysaccharide chain length determinant N-terminal domain-containing protein n=1 Tax=Homoserinibacter gongjuensis TaxID=1162968 RepID=A0ABQ6JZ62_9MICO|nr:hypothetical protein [Homoserinibacter gongjuensis]GMA92791.1 hypothetical protein GCM10025869_33200 [Homoserinibacter gongjuensis]
METPHYPSAYRERWYVVVLAALLGLLAAAAISAVLPRSYEATSTLFLRVDSPIRASSSAPSSPWRA